METELRVGQFWSEIILVISNRTRYACSFDFEITRILHSTQSNYCYQGPLDRRTRATIRVRAFRSEHAHFKKCRPPNLMRMLSTENSYSYSSSDLKVPFNLFKTHYNQFEFQRLPNDGRVEVTSRRACVTDH